MTTEDRDQDVRKAKLIREAMRHADKVLTSLSKDVVPPHDRRIAEFFIALAEELATSVVRREDGQTAVDTRRDRMIARGFTLLEVKDMMPLSLMILTKIIARYPEFMLLTVRDARDKSVP